MQSTNNQHEWKCRTCQRQFDTRGKRDAHHRKEHQKAVGNVNVATENNSTTKNAGEKFSCPCGKEFLHPWSLQRHSKGCNAPMLTVGHDDDNSHEDEGTLMQHSNCAKLYWKARLGCH